MIHVVVRDLPLLATVGSRQDVASIFHLGCADVVKHGMGPPPPPELVERCRDRPLPDLPEIAAIGGVKVKTTDFR